MHKRVDACDWLPEPTLHRFLRFQIVIVGQRDSSTRLELDTKWSFPFPSPLFPGTGVVQRLIINSYSNIFANPVKEKAIDAFETTVTKRIFGRYVVIL